MFQNPNASEPENLYAKSSTWKPLKHIWPGFRNDGGWRLFISEWQLTVTIAMAVEIRGFNRQWNDCKNDPQGFSGLSFLFLLKKKYFVDLFLTHLKHPKVIIISTANTTPVFFFPPLGEDDGCGAEGTPFQFHAAFPEAAPETASSTPIFWWGCSPKF